MSEDTFPIDVVLYIFQVLKSRNDFFLFNNIFNTIILFQYPLYKHLVLSVAFVYLIFELFIPMYN